MFDRLAQSRSLWAFVMLSVAALGAVWTARSSVPGATPYGLPPTPKEGFPAPDFELPDRNDSRLSLRDLRGQVVVLNLWASWCPPCRAEMPALESIHRDLASRGAIVIAVNATHQDSRGAALAFADELGLSFPILFDDSGEVSRMYQLQALPSTFLVGRDGTIHDVYIGGPLSAASLRAGLEALLVED